MKLFSAIIATSLFGSVTAFAPSPITKQSTTLHISSVPEDPFWGVAPKANNKAISIKVGDKLQKLKKEDVVIDPDYYLTWCFALVGALITWYHPHNADGSLSVIGVGGGAFHMLFASLLWVQTRRVRLVFEKDAFEFYNIKGPSLDLDNGAWLEKKPNNYVSGTVNRWKYDTITNWNFFPSLEYPVIIYFKETETPEEQWDKWFAAFDAKGKGQPHFFPGLANARQFKRQMELKGVTRKPIKSLRDLKNED